jgi:thioredoxin 1
MPFLAIAMLALGLVASPAGQAGPKKPVYDEAADARTEITQAIRAAHVDGRRILLVFGANWCGDCLALDARFHEPPAKPIVDANFHVIHVDIGRGNKNQDLAQKYGIPLDRGVPAVAVLDTNGVLLYSQKNGEFEPAARLGAAAIVDFLNRWKPAAH